MKARLALAVVGSALGAATLAPAAMAHPLGNFTTNQLAQVRIDDGEVRVDYVLDLAEIPTFQEIQRFDADGDGAITGAEGDRLTESTLAEVSAGLELSAGARPVPLSAPQDPELSFPPGQGGLVLTRIEAAFTAPLSGEVAEVELINRSFAGRVGWNAIQILPGEGTDITSSVPATDPTDGLRSYPQDLIQSPSDVREARFEVSPGTGQVTAPEGLSGEQTTVDRAQDGFANALAGGETGGILTLFLLGAAFGWGALHALSPGHGKSMVAAYLAGTRATPKHAVILGATVTVTHTFTVFAFGLVILAASQFVVPERIYPWLSVVSGLLVVAIGFAVMAKRLRRWHQMRAPGSAEHAHDDAHDHGHDDHHDHGHADGHHHHHHHPPAGEPITMRGLIGLGVSGGLVPCPSALVVLVAAISQHRLGLGMGLIFAFSVGLAATLIVLGLAVVWGGRLVERLQLERRVFGGRLVGALPAVSATVIILAGVLITLRAIPEIG